VEQAGGEPVRIPLESELDQAAKLLRECDAVLLPGSRADIDPEQYQAQRHPKTNPSDPHRDEKDTLLLKEAFKNRKPILGICYGLQALNVFCRGTLVQHLETGIDHTDKEKKEAHRVLIQPGSHFAKILSTAPGNGSAPEIGVNSSHHQAAETVGEGLRAVARSQPDGVIEALEGTSPDHFVLAVQWHPERSLDEQPSQAIFGALVEAARRRQKK
jgi:putative glutamine amidotransferase